MDFRLCILTPTTGFTRMDYSMSLYALTYAFMTQKICDGKQSIDFYAIEGSGVSANREKLIDMSADSTHILFIDEDMGYEPDALFLLMKRKKSVVGCNYKIKIENGNFMAMALDRKGRISLNDNKTGIEPVYYTGFGFCLIERNVFDKIEKPWFLHKYKDGNYTTEESGFAEKLMDAGITWYVDHDASKKVYHVGTKKYVWN